MQDKKNVATRQAYGEFLAENANKIEDLVVLDADLSKSTKTADFKKECPERFINMGIAEQNMFGVAAGLALSGKKVCASTFAMFASGRAFEIIRNSIGYTKANVKVCATHAGITVGEDGASHQTFEDIALMRTIPGMLVINPSDSISTKNLLDQAIKKDGPAYIRLGRSAVPNIYDDDSFIKIGKANVIKADGDIAVIATGIMVNEAMMAADKLAEMNINIRVIDMHTIKPLDEDIIIKLAKETKGIVTAEEHSIIGGLGSAVSEVIVKNCPVKMAFVGQNDTYGESGKPQELKEKYKMTYKEIMEAVKNLI
ncbi:MAG TPA: transketolase family protein [Anaerovoracaceae bacterium]|nr:transketolase family protein [Anaerovoracaceae bacterium]